MQDPTRRAILDKIIEEKPIGSRASHIEYADYIHNLARLLNTTPQHMAEVLKQQTKKGALSAAGGIGLSHYLGEDAEYPQ